MKHWLPFVKSGPNVAVIRLSGAIGTGGRGSLTDSGLAPLLEKAFKRGKPDAVALEINSPGGSPVQSSLIAARIRRLAAEKDIPVFAFVEDVAASGGYWLASAADEIFADHSSILGSIGVISAGFGANVFLARQGLERRVHTAGTSKSFLDPFQPEKEEDVTRLRRLLDQLHVNFIHQIKERRGDKLADHPDLFTGEVWIGERAQQVGLIDGIGHLDAVMKERFGDKVKFRRYGRSRSLAQRLGLSLVEDALGQIEERAAYARFGL
ncbi:S49 family peptidase [Marinovum sp. 2_MG-2023]|uniref:S49 family peptidase n=1 Tax=Roseobacteraceae TaxID=2854170 RepID=UPI001FCFE31F|nr:MULTISPECIES: S49 family peptidase [Roseobacteraceae]MCJ7872573.1 S49 family peptidase [Phaeobacter sp. J2-8]MDO6730256.1 S49 family peptidase [Marinovum sp. 2_MG-2023]MDO6778994.1 S49 family peptidase [Marinovum sp. 1_MG-2023]